MYNLLFGPFLAETLLTCTLVLTLIFDMVGQKPEKPLTYSVMIAGLLATLGACFYHPVVEDLALFHGHWVGQSFATVFKGAMTLTVLLVALYSRSYVRTWKEGLGESYLLMLFSLIGMFVLVCGGSLVTLYLGLEMMTLPIYALVAMNREAVTAEASMKYFVMGALASGMILYGISFLFGAGQTLFIAELPQVLGAHAQDLFLLQMALVFILVGIAFKLGVAPFHMWVPDVYQGAPLPVTLFISTAPKIAAFGMAFIFLEQSFSAMSALWVSLLMILAVASLTIGNFFALVQTNVKRLLAYSAIAQIGFVVLGLLAGPALGYQAALFYLLSYMLMTLASFGCLTKLSAQGAEIEHVSDLQGLAKVAPGAAFILLLSLFSLTGIPPLLGFYAKFVVLDALLSLGYTSLAVTALVFSVIGAFYYLRVVKVMYFEEPDLAVYRNFENNKKSVGLLMNINAATLLLLGLFPAGLYYVCDFAFKGPTGLAIVPSFS